MECTHKRNYIMTIATQGHTDGATLASKRDSELNRDSAFNGRFTVIMMKIAL